MASSGPKPSVERYSVLLGRAAGLLRINTYSLDTADYREKRHLRLHLGARRNKSPYLERILVPPRLPTSVVTRLPFSASINKDLVLLTWRLLGKRYGE